MRLYIDPGTGSMLFTVLIGLLSAGIYFFRGAILKLKFYLSGGKAVKEEQDRQELVIFTDSGRYWNVFEPICDELERRGQAARYLTLSKDDPALKKEYRHIACGFAGEGNAAFAQMNLMKAEIVLSSTPGLEVYQWKRSREVSRYVHIPHAVSDLTMYRMFGIDSYDAVLCAGDLHVRQVRELEALRNLKPKELPVVGITYMDALKRRLEQSPAEPSEHAVTVLLAPSWGDSAIFGRFGGSVLEKLLSAGYHVIVRPHPQSFLSEKERIEELMRRYPESEGLEWNRDNDNFEALRRADILVSDFSGVIFDFALVFDRPVIWVDTKYDRSPYDAWWLEEEPWTFEILPKIGTQLTEENLDRIGDLIRESLNSPAFAAGREQARRETWACVGESAGRTVDYLQKLLERLKTEKEQRE